MNLLRRFRLMLPVSTKMICFFLSHVLCLCIKVVFLLKSHIGNGGGTFLNLVQLHLNEDATNFRSPMEECQSYNSEVAPKSIKMVSIDSLITIWTWTWCLRSPTDSRMWQCCRLTVCSGDDGSNVGDNCPILRDVAISGTLTFNQQKK